MLIPEKIRLMTQLAIMEQEKGKELKRVQESFRSDYIGIPMLKNALRITAVFLLLLCAWGIGSINFILDVLAGNQLKLLGIALLTAYIVILLITLIITYVSVSSRYYRSLMDVREYQEMLQQVGQIDRANREASSGYDDRRALRED